MDSLVRFEKAVKKCLVILYISSHCVLNRFAERKKATAVSSLTLFLWPRNGGSAKFATAAFAGSY